MPARNKSDDSIREQAAAWANLLENGAISTTQLPAFHAWLEDPRHAREFTACQTLVSLAKEFPPERKAALELSVVIPAAKFAALKRLLARPLHLSGVVAAILVLGMAAGWFSVRQVREFFTHSYTTGTGEMRTIVLPDGTIARLNTQSRLTWIGSRTDRHVVLQRGEVLFEVVHDATRPFRITVDRSEIRDMGTQFDVYRKSSGSVVVTVLSGQVAVREIERGAAQAPWAERRIKADEQFEYTPSSLIADVHSIAAPKAVLWREGLLETEGQSFAAVVGELNRYSSKRIDIADPRLNAQNIGIGGELHVHDVPAALARIQKLANIVVTDTDDAYILSYKEDSPAPARPGASSPKAVGPNSAGRP
jgi:transmembrane sensor